MDSVPSRVEDILLALINNTEYDGPIISRVEQILYSFLENSEYAAEPESRVEAILVALKAAGLYNDAVISRIEKILYSKLNGTEYTAEPESRVEELLLEWTLSEEKELTGVVPLLFNANGQPLLNYLISGNKEHSGTPTPDNPIMPQGTGERTGNLWDESTIEVGGLDISTGAEVANSSRRRSGFIKVTPSTAYTLKRVIGTTKSNLWVIGYDANKNVISDSTGTRPTVLTSIGENSAASSFDTTPSTEYIRWYVIANGSYSNIMLNLGSTALPYEPYGYKISISSADTTTPVYLGEVQTTRKIKKLVLDGTENWGYSSVGNNARVYLAIDSVAESPSIATHYQFGAIRTYPNLDEYCINSASSLVIGVDINSITSAADFKSYLAAQYAAGTPVTVWYVLATPETGIVNEPLMKIGNYADTLSMEQAGVSIPTVNGDNTLDVLTTVKPSEVYIKYKGR